MHQDLFLDSINQLPKDQRELALKLMDEHPELVEHLRKNFEEKMAASRAGDTAAPKRIAEAEKSHIEKLLAKVQ